MTAAARVHIERLVIDGAPDVDSRILVASLLEALRERLSEQRPARIAMPEIVTDVEQDPGASGAAIAEAVYARILAEVPHG